MEKTQQLYEGKAKKVFATTDENLYIVDYKDDATAFNGLKKGTIAGKGEINNRVTNHLMRMLETKGIPIALMTAKHLSVPLLIARRDSRAHEGSAVKINYVAGPHGDRVETMTLERRAIAPGQRVLIVDDFAKNGGTLNGMADLAYEFQAQVVGVGVMVAARELHLRRAHNVRPLVHVKYKERFSEGVEVEAIQF